MDQSLKNLTRLHQMVIQLRATALLFHQPVHPYPIPHLEILSFSPGLIFIPLSHAGFLQLITCKRIEKIQPVQQPPGQLKPCHSIPGDSLTTIPAELNSLQVVVEL